MATPIEDIVGALVESHRELTTLVRLALLIGGALVLVGCIVLIVFLAHVKAHLNVHHLELRKLLKRHHTRTLDALEDSSIHDLDA